MKAYIALGSNLGDREKNIEEAIRLMNNNAGKVEAVSSYYYSEPQGFESINYFVNAVVLLDTDVPVFDLLRTLQSIEHKMGRSLKSVNGIYSDRIIDLDILLYDDIQMQTSELTIPHPRMQKRDFVMKPLRELTTKTISQSKTDS
jgi:2-amino-4-hydroxy-6-hydroxymethyldihydropteridine diphosphokinase